MRLQAAGATSHNCQLAPVAAVVITVPWPLLLLLHQSSTELSRSE
jgi:hypothetical protein